VASILPVNLIVTPVDGNIPYSSTGSIGIGLSVIPPGILIEISLPPLSIQVNAAEAVELATIILELLATHP
jgi:hypothetical protein